MRVLALSLIGALALVLAPVSAEDKELKLDGDLVCTKCALKETEACGHALQVKDGDKKVTYYIVDKGAKEAYHKECCTKTAPATVTGGKVVEKDGKKTIEGGKVEVKKEEKK